MQANLFIIIWILIFVRLSTMLLFIPIFSSRNAPMASKVLFISVLSFSFLMLGKFDHSMVGVEGVEILKAVIFEMINGMTIGAVAVIIVNSIYLAGHMIDMNMGFSMVNIISPQDDDSMPVTSNFYYTLMLIIFIILNAHHVFLDAFALSLDKLPLGVLGFNSTHVASFTELTALTFDLGFRLSMPIILTILVTNIILGLLSKAMPGMNVFMIGMPFKIIIGLGTLSLVFPATRNMLVDMLRIMSEFVYGIVARMYL